jgi:O-methyltransferase
MSPIAKPFRLVYQHLCRMPSVNQRAFRAAYAPRYRAWCEANPCEELPERHEMYRFLVDRENLADRPIDYLEFGVFKGHTIRWWSENNHAPDSTFVGFDSFEGLPEDWDDIPKGSFAANGQIPQIADPRCEFVKGLFQDTLPNWLQGRDFSKRIILHLDADLYSSTLLVLTQLFPKLKKDDVLIFDEFDSYMHEYRALIDAISAYRRVVKALCHTKNWSQAAFQII